MSKQMINTLIMTSILLSPVSSFAFFCPSNFQQIELGDSIEMVNKRCGPPDSKKTKEVERQGPQEWTYYLPQNVPVSTGIDGGAVLKTTIAFDAEQRIINITVNGIGVGATTICGGNIQLGESRESVLSTCGKPQFVATPQPYDEQSADALKKKDKITEYLYQSTPPVTLIFKNGKLVESRQE